MSPSGKRDHMVWLIVKYMVTAGVVMFVSEVVKRSVRFGALLAALPLVTFVVLIWMKKRVNRRKKLPVMHGAHFGDMRWRLRSFGVNLL